MTQVLTPRDVPLGGLRAMRVRRTLPQRERSLVGAWCFADHYGPDPVAETGGMVVPPHPHTGLQTVSWLFAGEVEHRDSAGHHAMVRPGELNLMTGGRGVSHSEVSTADTAVLHGVQLWVALPDDARDRPADFEHYAPPALAGEGWAAHVFLGTALGHTSPVETATPAARAPRSCSTPAPCWTSTWTPPSSTACWSTPARWSWRAAGEAGRDGVRRAGPRHPHPRGAGSRAASCCSAAHRSASRS